MEPSSRAGAGLFLCPAGSGTSFGRADAEHTGCFLAGAGPCWPVPPGPALSRNTASHSSVSKSRKAGRYEKSAPPLLRGRAPLISRPQGGSDYVTLLSGSSASSAVFPDLEQESEAGPGPPAHCALLYGGGPSASACWLLLPPYSALAEKGRPPCWGWAAH